jgi:hypothetical protein
MNAANGSGSGSCERGGGNNSACSGPWQSPLPCEEASAAPGALSPRQVSLNSSGASSGGRVEGGSGRAAWHEVHTKLAALNIRMQRVSPANGPPAPAAAGNPLAALAEQASTPHERLLVAKLAEASTIMHEQQATLKVAIAALAGGTGDTRDSTCDLPI